MPTFKDVSNLNKKTTTNKQVIEVDERRQQIARAKTSQRLNYYLYLSPNTQLLVPRRLTQNIFMTNLVFVTED